MEMSSDSVSLFIDKGCILGEGICRCLHFDVVYYPLVIVCWLTAFQDDLFHFYQQYTSYISSVP